MTGQRGAIICGFAGIGKSSAARWVPGVVDLESTPFEKDWERYSKVATHMAANGYTVLLSCHLELREQLIHDGVNYVLTVPPAEFKNEYLARYFRRGNDEAFLNLFRTQWDDFLRVLPGEHVVRVDGFLATDLRKIVLMYRELESD